MARRLLAIFLALVCLCFGLICAIGAEWMITLFVVAAVGAMLVCTFGPRHLDFFAPTAAMAVLVGLPFCWGATSQANRVLEARGLEWRTIFALHDAIGIVALLAFGAALVHLVLCLRDAPTRVLSRRGARMWAVAVLIGAIVMAFLTAVYVDQGSLMWVAGAAATAGVIVLAVRLYRSSRGLTAALGLLMLSTAVGTLFAVPTTSEPVAFPVWWHWAETLGRGCTYVTMLAFAGVAARYRAPPPASD